MPTITDSDITTEPVQAATAVMDDTDATDPSGGDADGTDGDSKDTTDGDADGTDS